MARITFGLFLMAVMVGSAISVPPQTARYDGIPQCMQPAASGLCLAYFPSWYYNPSTEKCETFIYGGCDGNANRFISEEECMQKCGGFKLECGRYFPGAVFPGEVYGTNGKVAPAREWPWVVSIKEDSGSEIICGGALLNSRTVVTAAHCLTGSDSYTLYFGKFHKLDKDDDDKVVVRTSNRVIIHPHYSDKTFNSDIGLIQFSDPIQFSDRIQPICLPYISTTFKNLRTGRMGSVAGFGENERGVQPDNLMYFNLPVQDNKVCEEYYKEQGIPLSMSNNMFCAGYPEADQATCRGDSGSALVFSDDSDTYTLEGLVSFATNGQCGTFGKYIVFTKVLPYKPWLLANI